MRKISVLGMGYIGLPTAAMFATHGHQVVGVDTNEQVVKTLNSNKIHIHEPGLNTLVQAAFGSGNLQVCKEPRIADVFIIAVPTPFRKEIAGKDGVKFKKADLSYVISATEAIIPHLQPGNLVILESTSPPRTTIDIVAPVLERSNLIAGEDFHLAYSPERVLPGKILHELVHNARVIGGVNQTSAQAGKELYQTFVEGDILLTDSTTAEMTKLMENTYRDVNIALANELSRLAERFDFDIWKAIELANHHPRVNILRPGPGVGGHCISVDPWFLVEGAPDITHLIRTARKVNDTQPKLVVDFVNRVVGNLTSKRIAILGLAYKQNVDDLRESPAIEVVYLLQNSGANVKAFDPFKPNAQVPGVVTVPSLEKVLEGVDVIVLLVAHQQFLTLCPTEISGLTRARTVVDAVNGWAVKSWEDEGFRIYRLGQGKIGYDS
jgi:UDP-N-acetyl-D-mannosaminuronic acid dehydrogenase